MYKTSGDFKHQSVRDLAWAISSPPLISHLSTPCVWPKSEWFEQVYSESLPWLCSVDDNPAELEALLFSQKDRRLGKYFETLWYFWLSQHSRYDIIEHNLQVIIDGQTLGEMDFIVLDKQTGKTLHWEVAVKFYLGTGDTAEMNHWHGPALRDRLDIKVEHLLARQSVFSQTPRVQQWLQQRGILIDGCAVILKGRLYYPWPANTGWQETPEMVSPTQCARQHLRSWWLSADQFDEVFDGDEEFLPLIKTGWMERIPTASVKNSYTKSLIFETVSNNKMRLPLHLSLCKPFGIGGRLFLTGLNWP